MPKKIVRHDNNSRRWWQLVALGAMALLAFCLFSLSELAVTKRQLDERANALRSEVTVLQKESTDLEKEAARLQTDEALEELAREELGWTKSGDTAVVMMVPTPTPAPLAVPASTTEANNAPNWQRWWQMFFGN